MFFKNGSNKFFRQGLLSTGVVAAIYLATAMVVLGVFADEAMAIRITMKRVIFEGSVRTEVLTIINNTAEEQAYRLGWRTMYMTPDRHLVRAEEGQDVPGLKLAESMVRFAPRRVVLPAGSTQQIRLMVRKPRDLEPGEYRSHFWIQPEAEAESFSPDTGDLQEGQSAVVIKMLTGLTLPVFVRHGDLTVSATISNVSFGKKGDKPAVQFTINREGNRSVYGDISLLCRGASGEERDLILARGVAVYAEIDHRNLTYQLKGDPSECSSLRLVYTSDSDDNLFRGGVIAEAVIK